MVGHWEVGFAVGVVRPGGRRIEIYLEHCHTGRHPPSKPRLSVILRLSSATPPSPLFRPMIKHTFGLFFPVTCSSLDYCSPAARLAAVCPALSFSRPALFMCPSRSLCLQSLCYPASLFHPAGLSPSRSLPLAQPRLSPDTFTPLAQPGSSLQEAPMRPCRPCINPWLPAIR